MNSKQKIVCVIGPTASGKTARAIAIAKERNGEVISVDSRQVYRGLDIGTEKISAAEMQGVPHHLIDIRKLEEIYSAADFVHDATLRIEDISARGKLPILAGGTHFYIDALLYGLPEGAPDEEYRAQLEPHTTEELAEMVRAKDPVRFRVLDPNNRRRLVRALELIHRHGHVPTRKPKELPYAIEWVLLDLPREVLRTRIDARLQETLARGLIEEVRTVRERVGDKRLDEFGLEYRVVGEYLRGERTIESIQPALLSKLWQYAKRQKAWIHKLRTQLDIPNLEVA